MVAVDPDSQAAVAGEEHPATEYAWMAASFGDRPVGRHAGLASVKPPRYPDWADPGIYIQERAASAGRSRHGRKHGAHGVPGGGAGGQL